jgi:hypothetical protein
LRAQHGVSDLEAFGERLRFRLAAGTDEAAVRARLAAASVGVTAWSEVGASLEDVFLARIRASEAEAGAEVAS